eukprot:TRINITY_DN3097_c0_g1_i2.p1 TRINITY_DN3097_c0_g1~~TRINITY_DN3097_c0_g1_i2.p1  ORF type:complete len:307 (+),score=71.42 TRINITY_DN3097_c0_g1_i2:76-996(+)
MTQYLPPTLLALFAPRDPLPFLPPIEKPKLPTYTGISAFLPKFEDPAEVDYSKFHPPETREQLRDKKRKFMSERENEKVSARMKDWHPKDNPKATEDAYSTLFVSRMSYDTTESKLRREFDEYGPIKKIKIVHDKISGKPRGYAFIEFERDRDMKAAFKSADGRKIDGKRILVDVERGRTVENWRPRKFGGGLGSSRLGPPGSHRPSGRESVMAAPTEDRPVKRDEDRPKTSDRSHDRDRDRERERERDKERDSTRDKHSSSSSSSSRSHSDRDRERDRRERDRSDRDRERDHRSDRERERDKRRV